MAHPAFEIAIGRRNADFAFGQDAGPHAGASAAAGGHKDGTGVDQRRQGAVAGRDSGDLARGRRHQQPYSRSNLAVFQDGGGHLQIF
ncbi:MAG: hypothetical protein P8Y53_23995 [Pseudolabrys sp.]